MAMDVRLQPRTESWPDLVAALDARAAAMACGDTVSLGFPLGNWPSLADTRMMLDVAERHGLKVATDTGTVVDPASGRRVTVVTVTFEKELAKDDV